MAFGSHPFGSAPFGAGDETGLREYLSESAAASSTLQSVLAYLNLQTAGAAAGDASVADIAPYLRETMRVAGSLNVLATLKASLADGIDVSEAVVIAMTAIASDAGAITSALASVHRFFGAIEDALVLADLAADRVAAREAVIEAAALESLLQAGWSVEAVSTAGFQAALLSELQIMVGLTESAAVASSATPTLRLSVLAADTGEADDALTSRLAFTEALADGAVMYASVSLGSVEYAGWVLNTALRAVTEYRNFPFNSFAKWKGRYYGLREEGLYLLEGDDDAGEPIEAWIRGALQTFATNRFKRVPDLYLGYKADGQMLLKAVSRDEATGDLTEDWYVLEAQDASTHREGRIKLGRGLKSVYWAFELRNVDGADFALDEIALRPLILDRRI